MVGKPKDTQATLGRLLKIARNNPAESVAYLAQVLHDLAMVTIGTIEKVKEQEEQLAILLTLAQAAEEGGQEAVDAIIQEVEHAVQEAEAAAEHSTPGQADGMADASGGADRPQSG